MTSDIAGAQCAKEGMWAKLCGKALAEADAGRWSACASSGYKSELN